MTFTFKHEYQKCMKGVYIFRIGEYFYIGRSKTIGKRILQHQQKVNSAIKNYSSVVNSLHEKKDTFTKMYIDIARHILENPKMVHFPAEVIFCCSDTKSMCIKENQLLRMYENHQCCLNATFRSTISNDNHGLSLKKVGRFLYYFDPYNPNELMPSIPIPKRRKSKHLIEE